MIDRRALDAAVRRFPYVLELCRDVGIDDQLAHVAIRLRLSIIIAEYHRVLRHP